MSLNRKMRVHTKHHEFIDRRTIMCLNIAMIARFVVLYTTLYTIFIVGRIMYNKQQVYFNKNILNY